MNKPLTLLREEFLAKHIELVNTSGLPAFILADIMEDALRQLRILAKDQYEKDKAAFDEIQKAETENDTAEETE